MKKGQKRPYYDKRTKRQVIREYFNSSASMDELSEIHGVLGSNTVASRPVAERINGNLKDEFEFGAVFDSLEQAKELIEKVAQVYNNKRPHWSNSLLTPNEMHLQREMKIKTWRRKKKS